MQNRKKGGIGKKVEQEKVGEPQEKEKRAGDTVRKTNAQNGLQNLTCMLDVGLS